MLIRLLTSAARRRHECSVSTGCLCGGFETLGQAAGVSCGYRELADASEYE